jgi:hypothetical protein
MTSSMGSSTANRRSQTERVGLNSQIGIATFLLWPVITAGWPVSTTGFLSLAGGGLALAAATVWWWRTGGRVALILVDAWFMAYGLLLMGSAPVLSQDDGLTYEMAHRYAALLGSPQPELGLVWFCLGLIGAIAVWRSRRPA